MKKNIELIIVLCMMALFSGCAGEQTYVASETSEAAKSDVGDSAANSNAVVQSEQIYVYVCGCVNNPGVYALERDSRVCDALDKAGGVTENGSGESLNQAEHVTDGQTVYVPSLQDLEGQAMVQIDDGLIDINSASEEELMTLPGIGASKAGAIVSYRNEHGSFEKTEDLMNIPGIKAGVFDKIKSYIKVR